MNARIQTIAFPLRRLALALSLSLAVVPVHAAPGDPVGPEFQVNTHTNLDQGVPSVALDADGDFVVAWTSDEIRARRYASDGTPQGDEFQVNTHTTNTQHFPSVALDADGDFVIAWQSFGQDGGNYGIYAQRYAANGAPQGTEFRVNTTTTSLQVFPSVAVDADGDFVIAWESLYQDGSGSGIFAQRYSADGMPQGGEFQVNTHTNNTQSFPSVAIDSDGDFVIAWQSYGQDGSGFGVRAQRFTADGTPQGEELQVNSFTTDNQGSPRVASNADGDFVIAWESFDQDGSRSGIYAQRYAADGMPQGTEFQVNTHTVDFQRFPRVALDAAGDFVIAWSSVNQDGSDYGVYAQRYAADGMPQGGEFQVNTYTTSNQRLPSVALDAAGDFVVAWQSFGQDGSGDGIYAQRYEGKSRDRDGDGVLDDADNCSLKPNPDQRDSNGDGFGSVCDPDIDGSGVVDTADLTLMRQRFYTPDADADFNGDGVVNVADLAILKSFFNQPPGPAALP